MTKTEIKEKYDYLKSVWHDTGIWTKISLEDFIREIAEIAKTNYENNLKTKNNITEIKN